MFTTKRRDYLFIKKKISMLALVLMLMLILTTCDNATNSKETFSPPPETFGQIYLYGEQHGVEKIMDKEFELWFDYYHNQNIRHLFVELPYYTAEFLNIWVKSDSDDMLDEIYEDIAGTDMHVPYTKEFYKKIKRDCPETIFHGTDVGHQHNTTGKRYLKYLEENTLKASDQYSLTKETIQQGKDYYKFIGSDHVYRENKMTENFIREFEKLNNENIMGIYGGAHTELESMDYMTKSVPCMANQLKARYGESVITENLTWVLKDIEPLRIDTITVNGKDYEASYFGEQDISSWAKDYLKREFWRLENAYDDFKDKAKTGDVLPYDNYTTLIETRQIFVIDYTKKDGSVTRMYYRSDGNTWDGKPSTEEFNPD